MAQGSTVKETLSHSDLHVKWEENFRNDLNESFFNMAFQDTTSLLDAAPNATILDAGCGSCRHSMRLAKSGFNVTAVDYADYIIEKANENVANAGLQDKITTQIEDLTHLSFPDNHFEYVLCWGVLMHIPAVRDAIRELCRVLKPGGKLVISEINVDGLETRALHLTRRFFNKKNIKMKRVDEGLETWMKTDTGELLSRKLDIKWATKEFRKYGVHVKIRKSGQFTEMYTKFSNKLIQKAIHTFNKLWFKNINIPSLAAGNILILEKENQSKPQA